ncbi:dioxygenase family protein [Streptacidiphilus rugosus]|uniref:dioxygenase family protein n=1 Tax=Streptacidiphilus rugosus TaxID=405783 RepID=UPI00055A8AF4|nr:dioxygenase [Streptacidiphilus rugosus]
MLRDGGTEEVRRSFAQAADPRARLILDSLTRHLHAFVKEVRPSREEWAAAIDFLTRTGQRCDDTRQEFILLSDVLGVSMLVEELNAGDAGTESTVVGPFHVGDSPVRELGASIDLLGVGEPCVVTGRVVDLDGTPLRGATVDIWQWSADGYYDVQQPDRQPQGNGRGLFTADAEGRFWFRTVVPSHYPIPTDGPAGELLRAAGRHPYRPAHIHVIAAADGHDPVTTHAFVADSPYLDSDAVFAVRESLIRPFDVIDEAERAAAFGVTHPFRLLQLELVLG